MASSSPICEGVFAINKPPAISSAQVIRNAQEHFKSSKLFQPWLEREQARKDAESHNQKQKRRSWKQRQPLQVKMGHGGTLDPMATGVLILGVGSGTKKLNTFLECTKSYEAVVLFGAATDSYDSVGKVVARKQYDHITKEAVEQALERFRGKIMQRPPIFSALRIQGKRLYEYAREGKELPVEIQERPVEVEKLELLEWMDGGTHEWHWPVEEAEKEEKDVVEEVLHLNGNGEAHHASEGEEKGSGAKRKRQEDMPDASHEPDISPSLKRPKSSSNAEDQPSIPDESSTPTIATAEHEACPAPACRLRMTVTSGFYVRSLCHDLGAAVGSLALMAGLVRTRQGDFELGKNVLEYADLAKGEEVWGPTVSGMLEEWSEKNAGEEEEELKQNEPSEGSRKRRNSSSDEA